MGSGNWMQFLRLGSKFLYPSIQLTDPRDELLYPGSLSSLLSLPAFLSWNSVSSVFPLYLPFSSAFLTPSLKNKTKNDNKILAFSLPLSLLSQNWPPISFCVSCKILLSLRLPTWRRDPAFPASAVWSSGGGCWDFQDFVSLNRKGKWTEAPCLIIIKLGCFKQGYSRKQISAGRGSWERYPKGPGGCVAPCHACGVSYSLALLGQMSVFLFASRVFFFLGC